LLRFGVARGGRHPAQIVLRHRREHAHGFSPPFLSLRAGRKAGAAISCRVRTDIEIASSRSLLAMAP
jgi:hypothetical protein